MPLPDSELLRTFAREADESAFAELVKRRIDFVYAAALRQVAGDTHCAQDVTQEVFIKLARHATALAGHPAFLGWLCTTTHHAAVDAIRREQQRRVRETEATTMQAIDRDGAVDWAQLQPVLDEALTSLPERDREIVLARFFARQPFAEIARELGISENAAQHRADRALDKLRAALARQRITSTSAALGILLANQPTVAAPAALATSVTQVAVANATLGATTGAGLFVLMSTTKTFLGLSGAAVVLGLATLYLGAKSAGDADAALVVARQHEATLTSRLEELEKRMAAEVPREAAVERKNRELLSTAQKSTEVAPPAESEPITSDTVRTRFRNAQELARSGDPAEALRELIWCYDVGMPKVGQTGPVRNTSLLIFGRLGERHPPALAWLRERRDAAKQRAVADERDDDSITEYSAINRALKDQADSIALLDTLSPEDRRRRTISFYAYDYLIDQQRYSDAARGMHFSTMIASLERLKEYPGERESFLTSTARNIETLAGAGNLAQARELAERLLKLDPSETTRALIQRHAERAGQPTLLNPQPSNP